MIELQYLTPIGQELRNRWMKDENDNFIDNKLYAYYLYKEKNKTEKEGKRSPYTLEDIYDVCGLEDECPKSRISPYLCGLSSGYELLDNEIVSDDETNEYCSKKVKSLEKTYQRVKIEQKKLNIRNYYSNLAIRNAAKKEYSKEEMIDAMRFDVSKYFNINIDTYSPTEARVFLLLSDFHAGMGVDKEYNNTYNRNVFIERLIELAHKTIYKLKQVKPQVVYCNLLGDMINGIIHEDGLKNASESNAYRQCKLFAHGMAIYLTMIAGVVPKIYVAGVKGNHDRMYKQMDACTEQDTFYTIYMRMLLYSIKSINEQINKEKAKNNLPLYDTIQVIPNNSHATSEDEYFDMGLSTNAYISGTDDNAIKIILAHGENTSKTKAAQQLTELYNQQPDYVFMGHFHQSAKQTNGKTTIYYNGALCGPDKFAQNKGYNCPPSQSRLLLENGIEDFITFELQSGWSNESVFDNKHFE